MYELSELGTRTSGFDRTLICKGAANALSDGSALAHLLKRAIASSLDPRPCPFRKQVLPHATSSAFSSGSDYYLTQVTPHAPM